MQINPKNFLEMLTKASLKGTNADCVINSTEEGSSVVTIDESQSIYVHANCAESLGTCSIGIGRLSVLTKYLRGVSNAETVTATVQDNRLVFTNGKTNFRYLLTDVRDIRCQPEELVPDDMEQIVAECPYTIPLTEEARTFFLTMYKTTEPNTVTIKMTASGRVTLAGGGENEHNFDRVIGNAETRDGIAFQPVNIVVYGGLFNEVINALTSGPVTLMLAADSASLAIVQNADLFSIKALIEG